MDFSRTLALLHSYHDFLKCGILILLPLVQLRINFCGKKENTVRIITLKKDKASTAKPNGKTPPGDKIMSLETRIVFYEEKECDRTEGGE